MWYVQQEREERKKGKGQKRKKTDNPCFLSLILAGQADIGLESPLKADALLFQCPELKTNLLFHSNTADLLLPSTLWMIKLLHISFFFSTPLVQAVSYGHAHD